MELTIIAIVLVASFISDLYFRIRANSVSAKRYEETKEMNKKNAELEKQLDSMNSVVLNSTNEVFKWKETAVKLDSMVRERDKKIKELEEAMLNESQPSE